MLARKVIEIVRDRKICYECLGRQFSLLSTQMTNTFRAKTLLNAVCMDLHQYLNDNPGSTTMDYAGHEIDIFQVFTMIARNTRYLPAIKVLEKYRKSVPSEEFSCEICHDILLPSSLASLAKQLSERVKFYEFRSFLLGSRFPAKLIEKEEEFRAKYDLWHGEAFKSNFNRELGKQFSDLYDIPVDFSLPDILFVLSFDSNLKPSIELQVHPLFVQGRYKKYARGIPQTKWVCRICRGRKINAATREICSHCDGKGQLYPTSVEEEISGILLEFSQGTESKFHGAGREDIDARCLGTGRPFAIEIKNARVRRFDLELAEKLINENQIRVSVHQLAYSSKGYVQKIKERSQFSKKKYQALTHFSQPVSEEEFMENLGRAKELLLKEPINQRTPNRVSHRRADHVRSKDVFEIDGEYVDSHHANFFFTTQGGAYIKELISGDEGRTKPNLAEIFGTPMKCVDLDILAVQEE